LRLLEKGAINAQNHDGSTALHRAAEQWHWEVVQLLLEKGADVSLRTTKGETVLHKAFLAKDEVHVAGLQLLFDKGIDANSRAKYGTTALHISSRRGQAAALGLLFDEGADINAKDDEGTTPLLAAIMWQCDEVLDILLERGLRVDTEALHPAAAGTCVPILLRLLKGVAEINTKDERERTLLHRAASVGTCEAVELLLENGADVHTEDIMSETPLHKAVRRGCQGVVEILCRKGANINQHACSGYTPLHLEFRIQFDFIDELLKEGEESGEGPFHAVGAYEQAVRIGNEMVKLLLSKGSKGDDCGFSKETVLHMAAVGGDVELVELLLNSGANVNSGRVMVTAYCVCRRLEVSICVDSLIVL
jgi:uncharacterized protein